MLDKQEFIDKATKELGGDFFAKLDATILWEFYKEWKDGKGCVPQNNARQLFELAHAAITSAIERRKSKMFPRPH